MTAVPASSGDDSSLFSEDLRRAADGDLEARNRLWANHYETLQQCAKAWVANHWQRRGDGYGVSLCGTDIVNAAYERLHDRTAALVNGKSYFFRVFYTECMRIVVDHWRKTKNDKGRGKHKRVELQSQFLQDQRLHADFDVLYELLAELRQLDERVYQVAVAKVFDSRPVEGETGATRGLTNQEVAEMLDMGLRTVEKDWAFAKAWLLKKLGDGKPS